jgi:hypothetical protein
MCNVATLKCKNSNVPCNTSDVDQQAKMLLKQALYFKPPVMSGGMAPYKGEPWGAGFDRLEVGNFAQGMRWGYDSYSFK